MRWGEKRQTHADLAVLARRAGSRLSNGGGTLNTLCHIAGMRDRLSLPVHLSFIDTSEPWPELSDQVQACQIQLASLGLEEPKTNVVFTGSGCEDSRGILTSADPSPAKLNGQWPQAEAVLKGRIDVLIFNSLKDEELR
jgi:hypothetical protein